MGFQQTRQPCMQNSATFIPYFSLAMIGEHVSLAMASSRLLPAPIRVPAPPKFCSQSRLVRPAGPVVDSNEEAAAGHRRLLFLVGRRGLGPRAASPCSTRGRLLQNEQPINLTTGPLREREGEHSAVLSITLMAVWKKRIDKQDVWWSGLCTTNRKKKTVAAEHSGLCTINHQIGVVF